VLYYADIDGLNVLITEIVYDQSRIDNDKEYEKKFARYLTAMNLADIGNKEEAKTTNSQSALAAYSITGFVKKQTISYDDILTTMTAKDIEAYNKRTDDHKIDMSDVKFAVYKDIKTAIEFPAPVGERLNIYNKVWLNAKNDENTISYSAHPYAASSFEDAKNNAVDAFIRNFHEDTWTIQNTTSSVVIDENKKTAKYSYNLVSKEDGGLKGYYLAKVSGQTLFVTYFRYDEKKLNNPDYYKKYLQYRIAVNHPSFGKQE